MSRLWGWRLALPPALALLLVGGVLPWVSSAYVVSLAILLFLSLTLAQSWNLISGYTGYVSFGHVVFFGVGAYTGALLVTRWEWPWLPALLMSGAAAALLALGVGAICLRLRGAYFAIAMLGLNEAVQILASTWESLTGGGLGLTLPPLLEREQIYYLMGGLALGSMALAYVVASSRFGLQLLAIREDEVGAEAVGVPTTRRKIEAFVLSAVPAGMAGSLHAWYVSYIDPASVFSVLMTIQMIVMVLLGGAGTVLGPVVGAAAYTILNEIFWVRFPFLQMTLVGAAILLLILYMPMGVLHLLQERGVLPRTRKI